MTTPQGSAGIRLRTLWAIAAAVAIGVAIAISAALVLLTTYIHQTNVTLAAAVESLRLAREAELQLELLAHARPEGLSSRRYLRNEVLKPLLDATHTVITTREADALRDATIRIRNYLNAVQDPETSQAEAARLRARALDATDAFVAVNVAQSVAARAQADRWDSLADGIAAAACVFLIGSGTLFLGWLRVRAIRPLLRIADAMEAYGRGRRDVRADDTGPFELREIARRFNAMADALAARRTAQMTFLSGVAHDLKNPLMALQLAIDARRRRDAPTDPRTRRTLDIVTRQTAHLERMVGDFLDIARIESGRLELKFESRDLRDLVREAAELFEGDPQHPLSLDLPPDPALVRCDPLRVQQIAINLISNAVKYSPAGGPVEISVTTSPDEVIFAVTDRGVGMTAAEMQQIFEPFARVGLAQDIVPGAGLGLHMVQRLVLRHGGAVDVDSEPGRGSTFSVRFPRYRPPPET